MSETAVSAATSPLTVEEETELGRQEEVIAQGLTTFVEVGHALRTIRDQKLYRTQHDTFEAYLSERWGMARRTGYQYIEAAAVVENVRQGAHVLPANERQARALVGLTPEDQRETWNAALGQAEAAQRPVTASAVKRAAALVAKPSVSSANGTVTFIDAPQAAGGAIFNRTNDNVDWAWWTWNPVTGCLHDCPYCYARDIANRFYPQKFVPTFHEDRLLAPGNTKLPDDPDPRSRRVFTCSMADLFGKWVPQEWIDAVFEQVQGSPQWEFLFLTKFPQRLAEITWPKNAWVGTTVDRQYRVDIAEKAFCGVQAGVKWLSCEPLLESLKFKSLEMFDLVVIGGASKSSKTEAFWPPLDWIVDLMNQARAAGCRVYLKPNAVSQQTPVPQELPASQDAGARRHQRLKELQQLEAQIECAGLDDFLDVAHALFQIREQGLWEGSYEQFGNYMQQRWGERFRDGRIAPLVSR